MLEQKNNCVFCELIEKKAPSVKFLDEDFVCIKNTIQPLDEIHFLICLKNHTETYFFDTTFSNKFNSDSNINPETNSSDILKEKYYTRLLNHVNTIIAEEKIKSAKIVINFKPPYASVPHAHLHIIGFSTFSKNKSQLI